MTRSPLEISHDIARHRFSVAVEGGEAVLSYDPVDDTTVDFYSTFVPPAARKRGVGIELVVHALDWAEREGKRVIPSCWFVKEVMDAAAG